MMASASQRFFHEAHRYISVVLVPDELEGLCL